MSKIRIIIDISTENDSYESSLHEVMQGILDGNRMGKGENDTESYEWVITNTYE